MEELSAEAGPGCAAIQACVGKGGGPWAAIGTAELDRAAREEARSLPF